MNFESKGARHWSVHLPSQHQLFVVTQAGYRTGLFLGAGQGRKQQSRKDADDRDDDQKFDQGETGCGLFEH